MAKKALKSAGTAEPFGSATSYDVARLAGVSQSAVSRCFLPHASISEKTRKKVLAAAEELNYSPNAIARSLITRRSSIVAVLITETTIRVTPEILFQLNVALLRRGLHLLLFSITEEMGREDIVGQVLRYKVDGVIACTSLPDEQVLRCNGRGTPVVFYNRDATGQNACSVGCDHVAANRDIAERLYRAGHRRLGFIAGRTDAPVAQLRQQGFLERLAELGVKDVAIAHGDFGYQSGHAGMTALMARKRPPTAVVCANDDMAFGAMDAARHDRALAVPDDVSVIGFDDVANASRLAYRLTTVRQPIEDMALHAVEMLEERIERRDLPPRALLLPGQLMVRASARLGEDG
jgi:DNA-binding LacI/PurR family transcriptional regulator